MACLAAGGKQRGRLWLRAVDGLRDLIDGESNLLCRWWQSVRRVRLQRVPRANGGEHKVADAQTCWTGTVLRSVPV